MSLRSSIIKIMVIAAVVVAAGLVSLIFYMQKPNINEEYPIIEQAPDFELINQDSETIRLSQLKGKLKVMTFFYIRCPMPNMCPLTTRKFKELQDLLGEHNDRVVLLSISFDPEDTPGLLRTYGELYFADFNNWYFLTGSQAKIDQVCDDYNIIHENQDDGTIRHTMVVLLVDGNDRIRKKYFANEWEPEGVHQSIIALLEEKV
ncbi:MAG: SCO family protein [bacterium]